MMNDEFRIMNPAPRITPRSSSAFTMIEIAISLAVIGFALVAIIGVLPFGMDVQRQNREDTIINRDASVFMNAIRNGARGLDELTNYVMAITNNYTQYRNWAPVNAGYRWYTYTNSSEGPLFRLTSGSNIVGLLSTPKYMNILGPGEYLSNNVVAAVRAISGPASEKYPQDNPTMQDLAFSYRMISEVYDFGTSSVNSNLFNPMPVVLQSNLHQVRLLFRWPLAKGTNALGRQSFQTLVGGRLTNEPAPYEQLYFLQPQTYVQVRTP
jgi:type II secretory pathway pseudopilin PulG